MNYRVLITKTLDVPKNLFHAVLESEDEAIRIGKEKLVELDGDVAIVTRVAHGETKVIHTFEKAKSEK